GMPREYDINDLANKVMARGWGAVAYPEILSRRSKREAIAWPDNTALRALRMELLNRFSNAITPETIGLIDEYVAIPAAGREFGSWDQHSPVEFLIFIANFALRHPRRTARAVVRRTGGVLITVLSQLRRERPRSRAKR